MTDEERAAGYRATLIACREREDAAAIRAALAQTMEEIDAASDELKAAAAATHAALAQALA